MPSPRGFGRAFVFDPQDTRFMVRDVLSKERPESTRKFWWANGAWLNQEHKPLGVEFAWRHYLADNGLDFSWPEGELHRRACELESDSDATTIRAAAKVLREAGIISQYRWAYDVEDVVQTLLTKGPLVVGTEWFAAMNYPNAAGMIQADGPRVGSQAYVLNGVDTNRELVRAKLAWGRSWGKNGYALISFYNLDRLMWENGDACFAYLNKFVPSVDGRGNGSDRAADEALSIEPRRSDMQTESMAS